MRHSRNLLIRLGLTIDNQIIDSVLRPRSVLPNMPLRERTRSGRTDRAESTWRGDMQERMKIGFLTAAVGFLFMLSVNAYGVNLTVRCGAREGLSTINAALKRLNPAGPNTLVISGTCKENVLILGFERLSLIAKTGAWISDASGGTGIVIDIEDSTHVYLQGFTITGGAIGVMCGNFSICRFAENTVRGASGVGVQVVQSRAGFGPNTIENNGVGLTSLESSCVRGFGGLVIRQNLVSGWTWIRAVPSPHLETPYGTTVAME